MADRDKIVVGRVSETDPANVVPGSTKVVAGCCGQEAWLSPASAKAQESHPSDIICVPCSGITSEKMQKMISDGTTGIVPGAFDELSEHMGPLAALEVEMMGFKELDFKEDKKMSKILNSKPVTWVRDLFRYTVKEQGVWSLYVGAVLLGVAYGVLASDSVGVESPGRAAWTAAGAFIITSYPLYKIFFYRVELELRMVGNDDEASDKMAIQLREKAKEVGLKVTHECKPEPIEFPAQIAALIGQPNVHPRHLVVEGFHWQVRKHASGLQQHIAAVSGVQAQVQAITHLNEPFPGDGRD